MSGSTTTSFSWIVSLTSSCRLGTRLDAALPTGYTTRSRITCTRSAGRHRQRRRADARVDGERMAILANDAPAATLASACEPHLRPPARRGCRWSRVDRSTSRSRSTGRSRLNTSAELQRRPAPTRAARWRAEELDRSRRSEQPPRSSAVTVDPTAPKAFHPMRTHPRRRAPASGDSGRRRERPHADIVHSLCKRRRSEPGARRTGRKRRTRSG